MPSQVRLFGRPEVEFRGRTVHLSAERRFQLLALLALRRGPVQRDWLATLFWPDRDNATARRNLRKLAFGSWRERGLVVSRFGLRALCDSVVFLTQLPR
jgi:hypothetical protein